jgi:hypothetical protein
MRVDTRPSSTAPDRLAARFALYRQRRAVARRPHSMFGSGHVTGRRCSSACSTRTTVFRPSLVAYVTLEPAGMEEGHRCVSTSSPRRRDRRRGRARRQRGGFPSEPYPSCPPGLWLPGRPGLDDSGPSPGGPDRSGQAVLRDALQPVASMGVGRHGTTRPAAQVTRVGQALGPLPHASH